MSPDDLDTMTQHASEAALLLKRLAHETRLLILCHLCEGELSVGELNERIPVSQSVLSQHLSILRKDKILATRRESQSIYYRIAEQKAGQILGELHSLYCKPHERSCESSKK